jgi:AcrR family transcriptional regulator
MQRRKRLAAQSQKGANRRQQEISRREARAQRILDAATALILSWGFSKTTLDDVARQAGVAKGTLYLHWNTREELFVALMKREKAALAESLKQRIAADPEGATLSGLLKYSALALMERPLLKAILLHDMDVLGKLAHSEHSSAAYAERLTGFKTYLEMLREHNLVRTDLSLRAQVYLLGALFAGFFLVAPLMPDEFMLPQEELAELLAETVRCTLKPAHPAAADALQTASQAFMQYLNRTTALVEEQFQQEVKS